MLTICRASLPLLTRGVLPPPRNQFTFDHNSLRLLMGRSKRVTVSGVLLLLGYVTIFASPSLSNESGFFTASSAREEFIQFLPSDCEYIAESSVIGSRSFFLIQPCHRGGGALLKEIIGLEARPCFTRLAHVDASTSLAACSTEGPTCTPRTILGAPRASAPMRAPRLQRRVLRARSR